jgi:hypothetical protein
VSDFAADSYRLSSGRTPQAMCATVVLVCDSFVCHPVWGQTHWTRDWPPHATLLLYMQGTSQMSGCLSRAPHHLLTLLCCERSARVYLRSGRERNLPAIANYHNSTTTMTSAILLFATLLTAVTAQVGRRHPYGVYPSPSITASSSSVRTIEV